MLSTAIRFGGTDHIRQHPKQVKGIKKGEWNLEGLKWKEGDFAHNLESMMLLSYDYISKAAPEIKLIDLDTGEFAYGQASGINSGGKPNVEEAFWSETASTGRTRSKGAGSTTFKRAIVLKTIL